MFHLPLNKFKSLRNLWLALLQIKSMCCICLCISSLNCAFVFPCLCRPVCRRRWSSAAFSSWFGSGLHAQQEFCPSGREARNVLLFDRECRRVKLADLGMTRRAGSRIKRISGTIPYNRRRVCQASVSEGIVVATTQDVWAFGVLLFCMLTGNFPWEAALPSDAFFSEFQRWQRGAFPPALFPLNGGGFRTMRCACSVGCWHWPERRCGVKEVFYFLKYDLLNHHRHRASCRASRSGSAHCSAHRHTEPSLPSGTSCLHPTPLKRSILSEPHSSREESSKSPSPNRQDKSKVMLTTPIEICV